MVNSAVETACSYTAQGEATEEMLFTACMDVRIIIAVMEGIPAPGILPVRRQMKAFLLRGHGGIHTMAQTDNDASSRAEGIAAPHGHIPEGSTAPGPETGISIPDNSSFRYPLSHALIPVMKWSAGVFLAAAAICAAVSFTTKGTAGLWGAICGAAIVAVFSEMTPASVILLERIGLKGRAFTAGFIIIWVFKVITTILLCFIMLRLIPLDTQVFALTILICAALVTPINVFGVARARVPYVDPHSGADS